MPDATRQTRGPLGGRRGTVRALLPRAILSILFAGVAAGPSGAWGAEPEIVVRVNGEPVTPGEVQRVLADPATRRRLQREVGVREPNRKEVERLAVQKLITRRLILQEANRRDFTVTERDLNRAVTAFRRRFRDAARFAGWMKARRLDDTLLREGIRTEILMTRVRAAVVGGVHLTEEQVRASYDTHTADLKTAEEVRLRIIAVKHKAAAEEIVAALQKGEAFDRLARERSLVPTEQGGDIGWVSAQSIPPPLRDAVGALKAGETGEPVQIGAEFLVVQVEERRPERTMSLAEARPLIERRLLRAKRQDAFQAWLTEQEKTSKVEVFP